MRYECGFRRLHEAHIAELVAHLKTAGIYSRPMLQSGIGSDEWIWFSRLPFPEDTITFRREEALKTLLADHIGSYGPLKDLRLVREEYRLSTGRRCDFLCKVARGAERGALVVVELKRTKDERTAEQVLRYLNDLRHEEIAQGRQLRALVITGDADPVGEQALSNSTFPIQWCRYSVTLHPLVRGGGEQS